MRLPPTRAPLLAGFVAVLVGATFIQFAPGVASPKAFVRRIVIPVESVAVAEVIPLIQSHVCKCVWALLIGSQMKENPRDLASPAGRFAPVL